jgi:hypothetical protein
LTQRRLLHSGCGDDAIGLLLDRAVHFVRANFSDKTHELALGIEIVEVDA